MTTFEEHIERRRAVLAQRDPCRTCGDKDCPRRHNVERQQEVVSALWAFATNLQLHPEEGGCIATIASGQPDAGTKCGLDHVGAAVAQIMQIFNYGVVPEPS